MISSKRFLFEIKKEFIKKCWIKQSENNSAISCGLRELTKKKRSDGSLKKMKTEISSVDFAEHGKGHMNWNFYERMLELYGKEVKITLVDKEKG